MGHTALRSNLLLFALCALLAACGSDGYTPGTTEDHSRGELVSATAWHSYASGTLQTLSVSAGINAFSAYMLSDVKTYKLVYWTVDPSDTPIKASGLLAIPDTSDANTTRLAAYHHGTIFSNAYAPTVSLYMDSLAAILASMNFIVTLPDYIGYGESVAALHPYMHADSLAKASIDMLRAAKRHMTNNNIAFKNQLLLGGYSEGGYAALATHKMIEENHTDEFSLAATAAGAGAYDMRTTADTLLNLPILPSAAYVAFVFKAYDDIYGFNRLSEIFAADYVDTINNDFYGTVDDSVIETQLTKYTDTLFNPSFLAGFRAGDETTINTRLTENNIYDWAPLAPVRLFHGQADTIVPYTNSVTAHDAMIAKGATGVSIVECVPTIIPANHNNCFAPYLVDMTGYFLSL